MRCRLIWTVVLLAGAWCAAPAGAVESRVLFQAGDPASDGVALFGPSALASDGRRVAFMGAAAAIVVRSGDAYTVVVRGGDPLPPPLSGTFDAPSDPVINDAGQVLFTARRILYLWTAGTIVPVPATSRVDASDLNDAGQVVYAARNRVFLSTGGERVELTPDGTLPAGRVRFRSRRHPLVLSDDGSVALTAQVRVGRRWRDALVVVSAVAEPKVVAVEGDPNPTGDAYTLSGRTALSVNASGQVAFVGGGVFVYAPATDAVTVVARAGDRVDGQALTDFRNFVAIDSHANVVFSGRFDTGDTRLVRAAGGILSVFADDDGSGSFAPRLTDAGEVVRSRGGRVDRLDGAVVTLIGGLAIAAPLGPGFMAAAPSINQAGAVAFESRRGGVYLLDDGPAEPLLTEFETTANGTIISSIYNYAFGGNRIAALAWGAGGLRLVARRLGGPLVELVRTGDPTPRGGTFDLSESVPKLDRRGVVFAADVSGGDARRGIFRAAFDGTRIDVIAAAGERLKDGRVLESVLSPAPFARGVAFFAGLEGEGDAEGLFVARGRRIRKIAASGDHAPGGDRFRFFGTPVAERTRVLFEATIDRRLGDDTTSLFVWSRRGGLARVAREGTRVRGGGRIRVLADVDDLGSPTLGFGGIVFTGSFAARDVETDALFLRRRGLPRRLFPAGAAAVLAPRDIEGFTVAGRRAVIVTSSPDGEARDAIVALEP
jgi:hypothetical protein